ncbi:MAG: S41 family peptidase [Prevotella sp.]|nr:S41 family peptidase [Prevotella sp.]
MMMLVAAFFLTACFEEDNFDNTRQGNFEALWNIMDERYCFFEYKDVDWNEIRTKYAQRISEKMSDEALFAVLSQMLAEVKDGHVNLSTSYDLARYWKWFEDYPDNFDERIQRNYLGTDYKISAGLKYQVLDDNIGYIYYESFSDGVGDGNLEQVLGRLAVCRGIIIDVRNNGGGMLSNVERIASRFFDDKTLVGYILHKTGKGHNDFSTPFERHIEPSPYLRYQKKVAVLTNRRSFSATNDFVNAMRYAPHVAIIGDKTGGGSGLPFTSELPNGWLVRFSASPTLDAAGEQIEFGIDPDIKVDMSDADAEKGKDSIIEAARNYLNSGPVIVD